MENKVRKIIRFVDCKSDVPIVEFILGNGDSAYAVVDTGSETTLFDFNLILGEHKLEFPLKKTKNKINFVGVQQDTEVPLVKTSPTIRFIDADNNNGYLYVKIDDAIFISMANLTQHMKDQYGVDMAISAILGSDMLSKLNAEVNYQKKEMIIDYDIPC